MDKKSIVILGMRNSGKTVFISVMANYLQDICNKSADGMGFKQDSGHCLSYVQKNYEMLLAGKWPNRTTKYEEGLKFVYDDKCFSASAVAGTVVSAAALGGAAVKGALVGKAALGGAAVKGALAGKAILGGLTVATGGVAILGIAGVVAGGYAAHKFFSARTKKELIFHDFPGEDFEKIGEGKEGKKVLEAVKKAHGIILVVDSETMANRDDQGEGQSYAKLFQAVAEHNKQARVAVVFNKLELFYTPPKCRRLEGDFAKCYGAAYGHLKDLDEDHIDYFRVYGLGSREKLLLTSQGDREFVPQKKFQPEPRGVASVIGWLIDSEALRDCDLLK